MTVKTLEGPIDLRLKITFASLTILDKFADHYFMKAGINSLRAG